MDIQIQKYLANKDQLYQDWYLTYGQTSEPKQFTEQVRAIPSTDGIKKLFAKFYSSVEDILRQKVCEDWCYCEKRTEHQDNKGELIAAIADILAVILSGFPINYLATATILYSEKYLDNLCACPKEIEHDGPESK
ncbi:hypothetical protein QUF50_02595 [Thiotrichales bacterium HSG1]|nr:hypothetical protein [Thiotrichales bacterium HSG1]